MHSSFSETDFLQDLTQVSIRIQGMVQDAFAYKTFFGEENVEYMQTGAESLMAVLSELVTAAPQEGTRLDRETRHDLRNYVAVVKGFSDLITMDLPDHHSARPMMEELSHISQHFVTLLDHHRDAMVKAA